MDEVNGKKIRTLNELSKAFAQAPERLVIRMIGDGPRWVLDRTIKWKPRANASRRVTTFERAKSRVISLHGASQRAEDKN